MATILVLGESGAAVATDIKKHFHGSPLINVQDRS